MEYYSLHNATTKIGRGGFPQSQNIELEPGRTVHDSDFVWRLTHDRFPNFNPYLGTLILQKGAAVTDFISAATISVGFICSSRVRDILVEHDIGETQFYKQNIKHKDQLYPNYYLLHCINNATCIVEFEKSVFQLVRHQNNTKIVREQRVIDIDEYLWFKQNMSSNSSGDWQSIEPTHIHFKTGEIPPDIFQFREIDYKTYISQRLKSAFESNKVTGIMFDWIDRHHVEFT